MLKKTLYTNPVVNNNILGGRVEFDMPRGKIRNPRLISFGVATYTGGVNRQYNYLNGSPSIISRISALRGGLEIASVRGMGWVASSREIADSGTQNFSVGGSLYGSSLQYVPDTQITFPYSSAPLGQAQSNSTYIDLAKFLPFFYGLDLDTYGELAKAVKSGNRKRAKSLIGSANVFPTDLMPIRIVIEYTTLTPNKLFVNALDTDTVSFSTPILVCDEIMGLESKSDFQIVYDNYSIESVTLPGNSTLGTALSTEVRLLGAIGSYVREISLINGAYLSGTLNDFFRAFGSSAQYKESINMIVNSRQFLPLNCDTPAKKQMYLNYSSPNAMCPLLGNVSDHGAFDTAQLYAVEESLKQWSFVTFNIDQPLTSLTLQYARTTSGSTIGLQDINMIVMYTVQKILTFKNGSAVVSG